MIATLVYVTYKPSRQTGEGKKFANAEIGNEVLQLNIDTVETYASATTDTPAPPDFNNQRSMVYEWLKINLLRFVLFLFSPLYINQTVPTVGIPNELDDEWGFHEVQEIEGRK